MRIAIWLLSVTLAGGPPILKIDTPMPPPDWALAQRALLHAYSEAAEEFAAKYVDERGYLKCVERWGGNDGPDDAMETINAWPLVHSLGAPNSILRLYRKMWEGHLRQFTAAKAPSARMAKDGMFHKEFVTSFDWEHTGEGLAAFHFYALSPPGDAEYIQRVRRFAGFYTGEDANARNYDKRHKIIRSILNGSRGPMLTPAGVHDWGGEEVAGAPERLKRYETATNVSGDHPLNLSACTLGFNAYALTGETKYRDWLLEYAGAWKDRVLANNGNIPTNIGLDGKIGGEWGGKWYGGTFGWNFDPATSGRNYYMRGARTAFGEAILLTGDLSFAEPLRRQIANLYAVKKEENGRVLLPNKYGETGWYGYTPNTHADVRRDLYLWTMDPADLKRVEDDHWIQFLQGKNPGYPMRALQSDFARLRRNLELMRNDTSTPDTRPSDFAHRFKPVEAGTLANLVLGGNDPGSAGNVLHSRLRFFDPAGSRAGLPESVAALVEKLTADSVTFTLVNLSQARTRRVTVQAGAYGEHEFVEPFSGPTIDVEIAPGAGQSLTLQMKRYANQPKAAFPWQR
ncbi:MAG: hypothetical protein FJW30_06990 [Acidobacteria bacterium]|nr:hypothetical protein [Acidobacteriota bacterium]